MNYEAEFAKTEKGKELAKRYDKAWRSGDYNLANKIWEQWDTALTKFVEEQVNKANSPDKEAPQFDEGQVREIIDSLTMLDSVRKDLNSNIREFDDLFIRLRDSVRKGLGY